MVTDAAYPWMGAWIGVVEHPFFAVTDADGRYTIRVGQERCVSTHEDVEAGKEETRTVDFRLDLRKKE